MKTVSFIGILTLITLIVMGLCIWIANTAGFDIRAMLIGVLVVYIPTILAFVATAKGLAKPELFWILFMTSSGVRLFVGLISILIVVFIFGKVRNEYIGAYFFSYFVLTAFEVYALMCNLRPISKKETDLNG